MFVVEYLHTTDGGHPDYTRELAQGLDAAGVPVRVLTGTDAPEHPLFDRRVSVPDSNLPQGSLKWLANRLASYASQPQEVVRYLHELGVVGDQLWFHAQQLPSVRPAAFVRNIQGAGWNVAVTVHNVRPHARSRKDQLVQQQRLRAWRRADLLLVHSSSLASLLADQMAGGRVPPIEVVPHPVWTDHEPLKAQPTRDFLFFGHLRENKGVDYFIAALAELDDPPATIAGGGSPTRVAEVSEMIAHAGLKNLDFWPRFVPDADLPALFADHRVVVTPYKEFEAQSGVTHLAVAFDRPIVVTDVGALRDLVDQFGLGEVALNPGSLALSMRRAREGNQRGCYQGGLRDARRDLSPEAVAAVLGKILARGPVGK